MGEISYFRGATLRLSISLLLVHVFCSQRSLRLMVLRNLGHAVLAKVQSAFYVEEVRSVRPRFQVKSPFCTFLLEYFYGVSDM